MAVWLAERVRPSGHVVATDIDTGYLRRLDLPNLEVLEHNILEDPLEPPGPGSFDLVCSRVTLFHLVDTQEVALRQMARCLRPGGWLIDEDADWGTAAPEGEQPAAKAWAFGAPTGPGRGGSPATAPGSPDRRQVTEWGIRLQRRASQKQTTTGAARIRERRATWFGRDDPIGRGG
jgi:SAM-dependent methyltransferase